MATNTVDRLEVKAFSQYVDTRYQQALRKSGKSCGGKTMWPAFGIAFSTAIFGVSAIVLSILAKTCYTRSNNKQEDRATTVSVSEQDMTTVKLEVASDVCSGGVAAGIIAFLAVLTVISFGLIFVCYRLFKRYDTEERKIHLAAMNIRNEFNGLAMDTSQSYLLYFLKEDPLVQVLDEREEDYLRELLANCWFEQEARNASHTDIGNIHLSQYLYTVHNGESLKKYVGLLNKGCRDTQTKARGTSLQMEKLQQEFDTKSVLTRLYVKGYQVLSSATRGELGCEFSGWEGLLFATAELKDVHRIICNGFRLTKGRLGKAVYLYENVRTAVGTLKGGFKEPQCLLIVRVNLRNAIILKRARNKNSSAKGHNVAILESNKFGEVGREFAFYDSRLCLPIFVCVYRRKYGAELQKLRELESEVLDKKLLDANKDVCDIV